MTNKLTLTEQEELFAKDCKLINLKYEYNGIPVHIPQKQSTRSA